MPIKVKPIDKAAERYVTNASAASSDWLQGLTTSNVIDKLKSADALKNYQTQLAEAPKKWAAAVSKLTAEDIFRPARAKGEANYRSGVAASTEKYKRGLSETVYAAAAEMPPPPGKPPMSPENLKYWQDWITKVHQKALERRGIK
jgi:hypothetical protein